MHLLLNVFVSFIMRNEKRVHTHRGSMWVCVCVTFRFAACKLKASWLWTADVLQAICNSRQKEHMLANRRQTKDLSETKTATMCDVHMQRVMPEILERRSRKTVENRRHTSTHNSTQHIITYTPRCVSQLVANSTVYINIYIFLFFCVFCLFLFIFRIVKQLAALLDTSRVRCFDKMWFSAHSLRQMSAGEAGLLQ